MFIIPVFDFLLDLTATKLSFFLHNTKFKAKNQTIFKTY